MNKRQRKKNIIKTLPYTVAKKLKPNEVMVIQFDMNDDNFDLDVLCNFVNSYKDIIPKETKMIIMPEFMSIDAMGKEEFRMFLDSAEEFYKTL